MLKKSSKKFLTLYSSNFLNSDSNSYDINSQSNRITFIPICDKNFILPIVYGKRVRFVDAIALKAALLKRTFTFATFLEFNVAFLALKFHLSFSRFACASRSREFSNSKQN